MKGRMKVVSFSNTRGTNINSEPANFGMRVVGLFKDPLSRQVTEAVMIKNHQGTLLNSKAEFHQPSLVRVRQEIIQGLEE